MALPWFRVYSELLNSRKFHRLSDTLKGRLFCVWCLAAKTDGILPGIEDVAFALRIEDAEAQKSVESLIDAGFLDRDGHGVVSAHDWQDHQHVSDVSTKRVQQFREKAKQAKQRETVSGNSVKPFPKRNETVQEAEEKQTQITPSAAETAAAIKLAEETFDLSDGGRAEAWNGSGNTHNTPKTSLLNSEIESALTLTAGRITQGIRPFGAAGSGKSKLSFGRLFGTRRRENGWKYCAWSTGITPAGAQRRIGKKKPASTPRAWKIGWRRRKGGGRSLRLVLRYRATRTAAAEAQSTTNSFRLGSNFRNSEMPHEVRAHA